MPSDVDLPILQILNFSNEQNILVNRLLFRMTNLRILYPVIELADPLDRNVRKHKVEWVSELCYRF